MGARAAQPRPAAQAADALQVQEITQPAALEALAEEWTALFDADPAASPFQSPQWLLAWRRAFLSRGALWTLALRREGALVGLAPFFLHPDPSGRRQLTLLGNGLSDRLDLIVRAGARAAVVAAIGRRIAERTDLWDALDFRDLPQGAALLELKLSGLGTERIEPDAPCPAMPLPADPGAVTAALPRSRRTDLRRSARRLSEIAPLCFTQADADNRRELLAALARLQGARWRARGETGVLADDAVLAFHEDATAGLLKRGLLQLEALWLGGRIIAVHYALRRDACGYSYLHAFDPEFAAFGPGWLLMAESLERARREGVRRFDFLRGGEGYKYAWSAADQPQWRRRVWR